ncbi:hypothetical protein ABZ400_18855 [Streptomyces sp. NPDC005897]|uniref:hypothetical protein n=1 Tax=Streptomyces sp. NPDC005897 TaxID=3157081 RepID=UPI0033FDD764
MRYARHAKGALTVTGATAASHALMSSGYTWARDSAAAGDTVFSGAFEFLATTAASWALMPLVLWAGMQVLGEAGNTVLLITGGLAWVGLSGYFIDDIDRTGGQIPILALAAYVVLCTGLAGAGSSHRG